MRRWLILLCALWLSGCGREPIYQSQTYVFGTLVDITIYGETEDRARALAGHVEQDFQRLHQQLHAWKPGGELTALNAALSRGESLPVSSELADLLAEATKLSAQSGGLFNPAIGGLIQLWGFQRDEFTPVDPKPEDIATLVAAKPRMTDLRFADGRMASRNRAVKLDLGGIAKGYALDRAAAYLRQEKVRGALINIGGNILAIGSHGEKPWRVGIQHPRRPGALAVLALPDGWAIGTSGDYQRFFERGGKRYCHLIDPRTGAPVQGMQAVTVLVPPSAHGGLLSDVASKPIFIAGKEGWREAARAMGVDHVLLVDGEGKLHLTRAMRQRIKLDEAHASLEIIP